MIPHTHWESHHSKQNMYPNIHCSAICNSQYMETSCLSPDEWIRKLWYIYTMEYYTDIKKWNWIACSDNEPRVCQSEVSQREKQTLYINTHRWNVKKGIPQRWNVESREEVWMNPLSGQEYETNRGRVSGHSGRRLWGKLKQRYWHG